jgi:tetratricopeptide (TPR) repeat protein
VTWGVTHRLHYPKIFRHAKTLQRLGRFDEAREVIEAPREALIAELGPTSEAHAEYRLALCRWQRDRMMSAEALANCDMAAAIWRDLGLGDRRMAAETDLVKGQVLLQSERFEAAELSFAAAMDRASQMRLSEQLDARRGHAMAAAGRGDFENALPVLQDLLAHETSTSGSDSPRLIVVLNDLSTIYLQLGDVALASGHAEKAYGLGRQHLPPDNWLTAMAGLAYAEALAAEGRADEARMVATDAARALTSTFGEADPRTLQAKALSGA